ncbi:MAG TPA: serine hydrolase [Blastocatellia bacterium]|nr:serine hydrolase [Blastocatellia bacterium]
MRTICKILAAAAISICLLITHTPATPQSPALEGLRKQLDSIAEGVNGKVGYSLHHLTRNESLDRLGDEIFPTDSTLKIAIMCAGMEKVERGEIGYYNLRPLLKEDKDAGGFFHNYNPGAEIEFKESMHQMITVSDNTATLMLMRWIGGTDVVNDWLDRHGLKTTRLLHQHPMSEKLKGDEAAMQKYAESIKKWGMGVSTPNEMRTLMEMIVSGKAGTPASSDEMHRLLNHQYHDSGIASQIPPWVLVASKSGRSEYSQSDMAVVYSPSGAYALTVFIKESKASGNGLFDGRARAIRAISRAVWRYYHPNDKWEPPAGVAKYWSK